MRAKLQEAPSWEAPEPALSIKCLACCLWLVQVLLKDARALDTELTGL